MSGTHTRQLRKGGIYKDYKRYRCGYNLTSHLCGCIDTISEIKAEKWLLNNLASLLENEVAQVEIEMQKPRKKQKTNIDALKEKLRRLDVMYMNNRKTDEEYTKELKEINDAIAKAEKESKESNDPHDRDLTNIKSVLETDFKSIYKELCDEEKQYFWRSIIKEMRISKNTIDTVTFH